MAAVSGDETRANYATRVRTFAVAADDVRANRAVRTSPQMLTPKASLLQASRAVHLARCKPLALTASLLGPAEAVT